MIKVTLKGGEVREYENGVSVADVAKSLGMGLTRLLVPAKLTVR